MKRSHGFRVLVGTIATCLALGGSLTNSVNAQPAPRVEGSNGGQSLQIGGANSTTGMTTRVTRVTSGELNAEDINQISHLAAHLITQINDARLWIDASNQSRAQTAIDKGLQLAGVIRGVLPVTTIHTTVRDRAGKVVYEDDRRVQQANVPLFQGMTRIQFLKPVIEAKRQAAAAGQNGVALSETSFVQSRVLLDVSYVQRRLSEADRLLATDAAGADDALFQALVDGIDFEFVAEERPLASARDALWNAHWSASNEDFVAARASIGIAKQYLIAYRDLLADNERREADELLAEVESLEVVLASPNAPNASKKASERIKKALQRVRGWFGRRSAKK